MCVAPTPAPAHAHESHTHTVSPGWRKVALCGRPSHECASTGALRPAPTAHRHCQEDTPGMVDWLPGWLAGWLAGWHSTSELICSPSLQSDNLYSRNFQKKRGGWGGWGGCGGGGSCSGRELVGWGGCVCVRDFFLLFCECVCVCVCVSVCL